MSDTIPVRDIYIEVADVAALKIQNGVQKIKTLN